MVSCNRHTFATFPGLITPKALTVSALLLAEAIYEREHGTRIDSYIISLQ